MVAPSEMASQVKSILVGETMFFLVNTTMFRQLAMIPRTQMTGAAWPWIARYSLLKSSSPVGGVSVTFTASVTFEKIKAVGLAEVIGKLTQGVVAFLLIEYSMTAISSILGVF